MINVSLITKSNHWPVRLKKVNVLIKKLLIFHKDLRFSIKIDYNCNIILTDNKLVKKMNNKFRKLNKTTDILTFVSEINLNIKKKLKICDIFISAEIVKKDAINNGIDFYDHLTHLLIHSFLHINGFLHDKTIDYNRMKKVEIKLLNKLKIVNPYL